MTSRASDAALVRRPEDVDSNTLRFLFHIRSATFNEPGIYSLRLSIHNLPYNDFRGVLAASNTNLRFTETNIVYTDTVRQVQTNSCQFAVNHFNFIFPAGFCKNDDDHEVLLLVEVFREPDSAPADEVDATARNRATRQRVGDARLAIYPRETTPPVNVDAAINEDMYVVDSELALRRSSSSNSIVVHPGEMKFVASLRKIDGVPTVMEDEEMPLEELDVVVDQTPGDDDHEDETPPQVPPIDVVTVPDEEEERGSMTTPVQNVPLLHRTIVKGPDRPLPYDDTSTIFSDVSRLVSAPNCEEIHVFVHGAINLPQLADRQTPTTFCSVKTKTDEENDIRANVATGVSRQPTCFPFWQHFGVIQVDQKYVSSEVLLFKIVDFNTSSVLICYRLPITYLRYFHQYHLEMIMPTSSSLDGVRLTVSIVRKSNCLPINRALTNYFGLEVLLTKINEQMEECNGPVVAALRIAGGYNHKRDGELKGKWTTLGIKPTPILFPNPPASAFNVRELSADSIPQITLPGEPEQQPEWNESLLFCDRRDVATLFTPHSQLLVEFYCSQTADMNVSWELSNPFGLGVLDLDDNVYSQLMVSATKSLRVDHLPMKILHSTSVDSAQQYSVSLILRLLTTEKPIPLLESLENMDSIPILQQSLPVTKDDTQRILDDQRTLVDWYDPETGDLINYPALLAARSRQNLGSYRRVVDNLQEQIITLTDNVSRLQETNASLRDELRQFKTRNNYNHRQKFDRETLAQKYADELSRLLQQTEELKQYRNKADQLNDELTRKSNVDTGQLHQDIARKREIDDELRTKKQQIRKLEAACREQEKNIDRLEKSLDTSNKDAFNKRTNDALREENRLLRLQLQTLVEQKRQSKTSDSLYLPRISSFT